VLRPDGVKTEEEDDVQNEVRTVEGALVGTGLKVGIVVARWNELVTRALLDGALGGLKRHGVAADDITVAWAPGSWEIPLVAKKMAASGRYQAVICLGAVIKGATAHFDYVAGQAAAGLQRTQLDTGVPIVFGILTTDTIEQALDRAGLKVGNKGYEAAVVAVEMANLLRTLE
jgi:6,7-dimethyl-8-ribityllumazine synthase